MLDQVFADVFVIQPVVELGDDGLHNEDVGPLVVATHVVDLANFSTLADHVNGLAVVFYVQPVPDLHTVAVDGELLVVLHIVDHQGDQLLRELVGAVVVGAAGDVDGHAVGVVERHDEHIRAGLGGGIGAVGAEGRGFHKESFRTQSTIDLVGGHLEVLLARFPSLGLGVVPGLLGPLQEVHGAHDVGLDEDFRVGNGPVHVALSREVYDIVKVILLEQGRYQFLVADVALDEDVARVALHAFEVLQVARVGQLVQVDQENVVVLFQHVVDEVGANEAGAAGDQIFFHYPLTFPSATACRCFP